MTAAQWRRARTPAARGATCVAAVLLCAGCEEPAPPHRYMVLTGRVLSCNPESGELTMRADRVAETRIQARRVHCVLTKDSELYVNDRFSSPHALGAGDAIEVIGYREPDRRLDTFVVVQAHVQQPQPRPVVPAVLTEPLATADTTAPEPATP